MSDYQAQQIRNGLIVLACAFVLASVIMKWPTGDRRSWRIEPKQGYILAISNDGTVKRWESDHWIPVTPKIED